MSIGAVVWACQRDRFGHSDPNAVEPTLTVNEARDFFEYQFSEMALRMTKATGDRPVGMMPGDFTPLWDKARIGANREMDGADVPIDPKFIFVAVFDRVTPSGDTLRQTVDVTQKLVVKKWRNTDEYEAFCYIASIVPTPEYHARHKNVAKEFRYAGSKGDFSGFVIYRTLTGRLVGVDNYENGRRTRHDYFPQVTDRNEDSVNMVARIATGNISLQGGTPAAYSMSMEDDDLYCGLFADPITCSAEAKTCPVCGFKYCICGKDNWPDHLTPPTPPTPPPFNPDYNDGGNTGGGGGSGTTTITVRPVQEKDCGGQAGENAANAQAIFGAFKEAGLQDFINAHINDNKEWGIALNYNNQTHQYTPGDARSGETGHVSIPTTYGETVNTTALFHTHPAVGQPHSIGDVVGLIKTNQDTKGLTTSSFVAIQQDQGVPPIIYALQIEDKGAADAFASTCNQDQFGLELQELNGKIYQESHNLDESYAYSMSYMLSKYNAGVRIMKYENGGFKQKEATVSGNTITRSTCK